MDFLPPEIAESLYAAAKTACIVAYAPYSQFIVGAAVLTTDGQIVQGVNVENASYGLTICAERIAIGTAVSKGAKGIKAIAVYADVDSLSPCGACRQFILEFGPEIIVVFLQEKILVQKTASELLPFAFGKGHLIQH